MGDKPGSRGAVRQTGSRGRAGWGRLSFRKNAPPCLLVLDMLLQHNTAFLALTIQVTSRCFQELQTRGLESGGRTLPLLLWQGGYHAKFTLLVGSSASLSLPECTKLPHLPSPWACWCAGKQIINPNSLSCWAGTAASLARWERQAFLQRAVPDKRRWVSRALERGRMLFFFSESVGKSYIVIETSDGIMTSIRLYSGFFSLKTLGHLHPPCLCSPMLYCPEHSFISTLPKEAML